MVINKDNTIEQLDAVLKLYISSGFMAVSEQRARTLSATEHVDIYT